jgi:hypothetical protein
MAHIPLLEHMAGQAARKETSPVGRRSKEISIIRQYEVFSKISVRIESAVFVLEEDYLSETRNR